MSGGRIRERGGESLGGEGVRTAVSPKEENRKGGTGTGTRAKIESRQDAEKKGKCIVHEDG